MDLSQYKMIRSKKFPLPKTQPIPNRAHSLHRIALISPQYQQQQGTYEVHIDNEKNVLLFNQHQYLKRSFDAIFRLNQSNNESVIKQIMFDINDVVSKSDNSLIIFNSLELTPIEELIFPWRQHLKVTERSSRQSIQKQQGQIPESIIKTLAQSMFKEKRTSSYIILSILSMRADGSLEDQLNYQWIEQSKYVDDLLEQRLRSKLKVKKYKTEIKTFDLNRQQIKQWKEVQQILYHYSQIKEYLEAWKSEVDHPINVGKGQKIGQIYQFCEVQVDEEMGCVKEIFKRKLLVKFNQFLQQSNMVMAKVIQCVKESVLGIQKTALRDFPILLFLQDCFQKSKNYHFTLLSQIGTNQTLKEQAICLNPDLQFAGTYTYLKNYCDKEEIVEQVKQRAVNFIPLTTQERSKLRITQQSNRKSCTKNKLKTKSINLIKEGEAVSSKLFSKDTYSWNEKKKLSESNPTTKNVFDDYNQRIAKKNTFGPYYTNFN